MRKVCLFMFLLHNAGFYAQAPKSVIITGKVLEKNTQQPLEFATIILLDAKENSALDETITNGNGEFRIEENSFLYLN